MNLARYIVAWIRAFASLAVLAAKLAGLRRDFDALVEAQQRQAQLLERIVTALNNTSTGAAEVHERLDWHEKHSAVLSDSAQKLKRDRRDRRAREQAAQHEAARAATADATKPDLKIVGRTPDENGLQPPDEKTA